MALTAGGGGPTGDSTAELKVSIIQKVHFWSNEYHFPLKLFVKSPFEP